MTTTAVIGPEPACPPWCTTAHIELDQEHVGAEYEVVLSTCLYERAEQHLACEREAAERLGWTVQPVPPATFVTNLTQRLGGQVRIWLGVDHSSAGYYLTADEARAQAGHLLALADRVSGDVLAVAARGG